MTTANDLITDVLQKLKVYAPGESINAQDSAWGLTALNDMLDSWSNESLSCFANIEITFPLVPGQNQYTIGIGGNVNVARPISISTGSGTAFLVDTNNNRFGMKIIEQDMWNQIGLLTEQSSLPDTLFYDPQFPLGIINVFPMPSSTYTVHLDSRLQLADMTLFQNFQLPPGYLAALKSNLYIRMFNDYRQGEPPAIRMEMASRDLATIKRSNIKISSSSYDGAIVSRASGGTYNIYTDGPTNNGR